MSGTPVPFEKARKAGPSRAGSDRRRPQAVPVATKEATGIDSRDEGGPFPQTTYEEC